MRHAAGHAVAAVSQCTLALLSYNYKSLLLVIVPHLSMVRQCKRGFPCKQITDAYAKMDKNAAGTLSTSHHYVTSNNKPPVKQAM